MTYTVLIVDDSKLARMAAIKALNALYPDWGRTEAANSDEALQAMATLPADIVLLDFNMPGQDGLELAAEILRLRPDTPVAVISANRQQEVINRTKAVGAYFLPKPLAQQDLGDFLRTAVDTLDGKRP